MRVTNTFGSMYVQRPEPEETERTARDPTFNTIKARYSIIISQANANMVGTYTLLSANQQAASSWPLTVGRANDEEIEQAF